MKRQRLNSVESKHARTILLSSGRVCNQEIARHVGCTIQWVRMLIHRFNCNGIAGIQWSSSKRGHGATYHRYAGARHFLAVYDLETGKLEGRFYDHKRASEFLDFLKWVRRRFRSSGTLLVVLDNYGTHLNGEVQRWAKRHRIKFYFTSTNASWLNRIESQFTELKQFTLNSSDYQSYEEMESVITSYLNWHNGKQKLALNGGKRTRKKQGHPTLATVA